MLGVDGIAWSAYVTEVVMLIVNFRVKIEISIWTFKNNMAVTLTNRDVDPFLWNL